MLKFIRFFLPFVIVLMCILGIVTNYFTGNTAAINGYFMATIGWITIAVEELVFFLNERKSVS